MTIMNIDTIFIRRCIKSLEIAFREVENFDGTDDQLYDIFRAASVKEFELVLEQSCKLLRKRLKPFFVSKQQVYHLSFKDVFRHAAKYGLINLDTVERWFVYRDCRNDSVHDYGEQYADKVLDVLPDFVADVYALISIIEDAADD